MSDQFEMFGLTTCEDSPNATSSPAADSGRSRSGSPDGPTTDQPGRPALPAPASAQQAKASGLAILATCGQKWNDSPASIALQSSLESRLLQRLDTAGSTLFKLTWKHKTTPLGRSYLERQASVLRTSGKDFTSWRSPNTRLNGGGDYSDPEKAAKRLEQGHQLNLSEEALIASWPTPQTHDDKLRGNTGADNHSFPHDLSNASTLASWPTPMAGTPATENYNEAGNNDSSRKTVELAEVRPYGQYPVRFTAGGQMLTGSDAAMESSGQLNPHMSRWLMGIPPQWCQFAIEAHATLKKRKK